MDVSGYKTIDEVGEDVESSEEVSKTYTGTENTSTAAEEIENLKKLLSSFDDDDEASENILGKNSNSITSNVENESFNSTSVTKQHSSSVCINIENIIDQNQIIKESIGMSPPLVNDKNISGLKIRDFNSLKAPVSSPNKCDNSFIEEKVISEDCGSLVECVSKNEPTDTHMSDKEQWCIVNCETYSSGDIIGGLTQPSDESLVAPPIESLEPTFHLDPLPFPDPETDISMEIDIKPVPFLMDMRNPEPSFPLVVPSTAPANISTPQMQFSFKVDKNTLYTKDQLEAAMNRWKHKPGKHITLKPFLKHRGQMLSIRVERLNTKTVESYSKSTEMTQSTQNIGQKIKTNKHHKSNKKKRHKGLDSLKKHHRKKSKNFLKTSIVVDKPSLLRELTESPSELYLNKSLDTSEDSFEDFIGFESVTSKEVTLNRLHMASDNDESEVELDISNCINVLESSMYNVPHSHKASSINEGKVCQSIDSTPTESSIMDKFCQNQKNLAESSRPGIKLERISPKSAEGISADTSFQPKCTVMGSKVATKSPKVSPFPHQAIDIASCPHKQKSPGKQSIPSTECEKSSPPQAEVNIKNERHQIQNMPVKPNLPVTKAQTMPSVKPCSVSIHNIAKNLAYKKIVRKQLRYIRHQKDFSKISVGFVASENEEQSKGITEQHKAKKQKSTEIEIRGLNVKSTHKSKHTYNEYLKLANKENPGETTEGRLSKLQKGSVHSIANAQQPPRHSSPHATGKKVKSSAIHDKGNKVLKDDKLPLGPEKSIFNLAHGKQTEDVAKPEKKYQSYRAEGYMSREPKTPSVGHNTEKQLTKVNTVDSQLPIFGTPLTKSFKIPKKKSNLSHGSPVKTESLLRPRMERRKLVYDRGSRKPFEYYPKKESRWNQPSNSETGQIPGHRPVREVLPFIVDGLVMSAVKESDPVVRQKNLSDSVLSEKPCHPNFPISNPPMAPYLGSMLSQDNKDIISNTPMDIAEDNSDDSSPNTESLKKADPIKSDKENPTQESKESYDKKTAATVYEQTKSLLYQHVKILDKQKRYALYLEYKHKYIMARTELAKEPGTVHSNKTKKEKYEKFSLQRRLYNDLKIFISKARVSDKKQPTSDKKILNENSAAYSPSNPPHHDDITKEPEKDYVPYSPSAPAYEAEELKDKDEEKVVLELDLGLDEPYSPSSEPGNLCPDDDEPYSPGAWPDVNSPLPCSLSQFKNPDSDLQSDNIENRAPLELLEDFNFMSQFGIDESAFSKDYGKAKSRLDHPITPNISVNSAQIREHEALQAISAPVDLANFSYLYKTDTVGSEETSKPSMLEALAAFDMSERSPAEEIGISDLFARHQKEENQAAGMPSHLSECKYLFMDDVPYYKKKPLGESITNKHQDIPLGGLQYVLEVQKDSTDLEKCSYICTLCSKKMSPDTLLAHVKSVPHRLKYVEIHHKDLYEKYGKLELKQWTAALVKSFTQSLLELEKCHGRRSMAVVEEKEVIDAISYMKGRIIAQSKSDVQQPPKPKVKKPEPTPAPTSMTEALENDSALSSKHPDARQSDAYTRAENEKSKPKSLKETYMDALKNGGGLTSVKKPTEDSKSPQLSRNSLHAKRSYRSRSPVRKSRSPNRRSRSPKFSRPSHAGKSRSPRRMSSRPNPSSPRRLRQSRSPRRFSRSPDPRYPRRSRSPRPRGRSPSPFSRQFGQRGRYGSRSPDSKRTRSSYSRSPSRHSVSTPLPDDHRRMEYMSQKAQLEEAHENKLEEFLRVPESHPFYQVEWSMYWERESKQLTSMGRDPSRHDFKDGWTKFWRDRLIVLCREEHEAKLKSLNLRYSDAVIRAGEALQPNPSPRQHEEGRSSSPWEKGSNKSPGFDKCEPEFSVMGTLRLLSKLEDQLGSLASSVSVLLMESDKSLRFGNNPINMFQDRDNKVLLRLCKDKLSSLVLSGVLGVMSVSETCRAIEACEWLQQEIDKRFSDGTLRIAGLDIEKAANETLGMNSVEIAKCIAQQLMANGTSNAGEKELQSILLAITASHTKMTAQASSIANEIARMGVIQPDDPSSMKEPASEGRSLFPSAAPESASKPNEPDNRSESQALDMLQSAYDDEPASMDSLSMDELLDMLVKFTTLPAETQQELTAFLKKLEATDSKKVTKLRTMMQQKNPRKLLKRKSSSSVSSSSSHAAVKPSSQKEPSVLPSSVASESTSASSMKPAQATPSIPTKPSILHGQEKTNSNMSTNNLRTGQFNQPPTSILSNRDPSPVPSNMGTSGPSAEIHLPRNTRVGSLDPMQVQNDPNKNQYGSPTAGAKPTPSLQPMIRQFNQPSSGGYIGGRSDAQQSQPPYSGSQSDGSYRHDTTAPPVNTPNYPPQTGAYNQQPPPHNSHGKFPRGQNGNTQPGDTYQESGSQITGQGPGFSYGPAGGPNSYQSPRLRGMRPPLRQSSPYMENQRFRGPAPNNQYSGSYRPRGAQRFPIRETRPRGPGNFNRYNRPWGY